MSEIKLTKDQQELIERMGVIFEGHGIAPAPARVSALLLVVPPAELPFEDISRLLNLSKSATSTALNLLLSLNRIEYTTKPGERRRYFRAKFSTWKVDVTKALEGISSMSTVYREVLAQRPKNTADFNRSLMDMVVFLEFLAKELPHVFKKWEQHR
ncbi:MAG: MarR family transcriptional regulator [Bacteroidetes bacterium]|nr:MarR family transcriptional regulator [Bacteroidota bacterium]